MWMCTFITFYKWRNSLFSRICLAIREISHFPLFSQLYLESGLNKNILHSRLDSVPWIQWKQPSDDHFLFNESSPFTKMSLGKQQVIYYNFELFWWKSFNLNHHLPVAGLFFPRLKGRDKAFQFSWVFLVKKSVHNKYSEENHHTSYLNYGEI